MTAPRYDSRGYWKRRAVGWRTLNDKLTKILDQAYKDYDQIEAELRGVLENCTCPHTKREQP